MPTCQFNTRKVGNLRRQSFREIWFGPEISTQRNWVRKCPGCAHSSADATLPHGYYALAVRAGFVPGSLRKPRKPSRIRIGGDFNCTPDSDQHKELTRLLGVDVQQLGSQQHFITYDGRTSDASKARTLDYVFIRSRQARLAYAATVAPAMNADRLEDRFSDHLAVRMDLRLEFVPLTAQSPTLDAGLAGGKHPF